MISASETRFSVISYASSPTLYITFSQTFATKQARDSAINAISYPGGGTATGAALNLAYNRMFQTSNGARSTADVTKVLIVLTDGYSGDSVTQPAQRLKNDGVIVYSIGVGAGVSNTELNEIASLPSNEHVFLLNNFQALDSFASRMSSTTCKANSYHLMCGSSNITLVIGAHSLANLDMNNAHLLDTSCKASHNKTHLFISTIQNQCGTIYTQTQQEIIYSNTLTIRRKSSGSVITREKEIRIHFHCTYSRTVNISGVTFEPPDPVLEITQKSTGNFTIELGSFANSQFYPSTSENYPSFKSFDDYINIQYKVLTANPDIVIRAKSCHATPTNQAFATPQYPIIAEYCDKDSTITHVTSGLQQTHQYRMQVFRFLVDHTLVYIHCTLKLCSRSIQNSVCTRSTTCPARRRRDVASPDATDQDYMVSLGPFTLKQTSSNNTNGNNTNTPRNDTNVNTDISRNKIKEGNNDTSRNVTIVNNKDIRNNTNVINKDTPGNDKNENKNDTSRSNTNGDKDISKNVTEVNNNDDNEGEKKDETDLRNSGQCKASSSKTMILFLMVGMGLSTYHVLFT
ncbi:CUB and zona pellucida-like domain-containing protein 1 [Xenia sp. Carnegie-2017]|uniref:CUB and zona pellucida-like domain-containing protein 1 n=1 Tax=Xenia sp. Carnegie-2017 TaxID=2897299 RepID=UPI001F04FFDB|nr:CUB and zona pellucida-like domain-containing protein 1 [Xenia sp. Carnegie-2017]